MPETTLSALTVLELNYSALPNGLVNAHHLVALYGASVCIYRPPVASADVEMPFGAKSNL